MPVSPTPVEHPEISPLKRFVTAKSRPHDLTRMRLKALLLTCLALSSPLSAQDKSKDDGFVSLFDGKSIEGWSNPYKWGDVKIVDGEIHLTGERKFFVITDKTYENFIFEGDVHLPEGQANSGFMFRGQTKPGQVFGYQAEVDGDPKRGWSGGLYDEGRRQWFISPKRGDKESEAAFKKRSGDAFKRNGWNTYRITCDGDHLKIEVNGVVTTDVKDATDASGIIGIQHHGEKGATYKFRNLRIKELK